MTKLNEKEIIDLFFSKLLQKNKIQFPIRDDVSLLSFKDLKNRVRSFSSHHIVIKADMLVESTDVVRKMKIWQIARKSIVSAVSDMSAKGIKPPYFSLLSIGIPRSWTKHKIKNLVLGFERASKEFGVVFVGGDTNESNELIIDCILFSSLDSSKTSNIPLRNSAKVGDIVITSGKFGYTSSGLKILLFNLKATHFFKKQAISRVLLPKPNQKFGTFLGQYFSSSIDSSDGLGISLYELAKQSKVNFYIDNIPFPIGLIEFAKTNYLNVYDLIFNGGEEYEILATVNPSDLLKVKFICKKFRLPLFIIGKVMTGNGNVFVKYNNKFGKLLNERSTNTNNDYFLLEDKGFLHFT